MADNDQDPSKQDYHIPVIICNHRVYCHKVFRLNYTSYDVQRHQDLINPRNHTNIITPAADWDPVSGTAESGHPFTYAHILGVFHADILLTSSATPIAKTVEFLWVRWYRIDKRFKGHLKQWHLHCLEFMESSDPHAYGFLNPDNIIHAAHLVPAFEFGK